MSIKSRLVKTEEIDSFFDLINKSKAKLDVIKAKSNNAEISMEETALVDEVEALAKGSIDLINLKSEYATMMLQIQEKIIYCTGILPLVGESADDMLNRVSLMPQGELVMAIKANGLVWED